MIYRTAGYFYLLLALLAATAAVAGDQVSASQHRRRAVSTDQPPMRFAVVRSAVKGCEPDCPEWIAAEGSIVAGTTAQLQRFFAGLGQRPLPILITSQGGSVTAAIQMGRLIRARKLDVAVGRTLYDGCTIERIDPNCRPPTGPDGKRLGYGVSAGAFCASACPLVLAGGTRRILGFGATAGVHQFTYTTTFVRTRLLHQYRIENGRKRIISTRVLGREVVGRRTTTQGSEKSIRDVKAYLREMGVAEALYDLFAKAPPSGLYNLTKDELNETRLVTNPSDAGALVDIALCLGASRALNCARSGGAATTQPADLGGARFLAFP